MNIAILGYGTVGKGVEKLALEKGMTIRHILMRKGRPLLKKEMRDDIEDIINDNDLDCLIECIGGDEPAFTYVKKALERKIPVISANKKMLAKHLIELSELANKNKLPILYSAACGGGIPFLPTLNQIKESDEIESFEGIINGTSNYILNKMFKEKLDFKQSLKKAQELGYAESDPSDDIDGIDTANKTVLGLAIGFDAYIKLEDIFVRGIRYIDTADLKFAEENNYHLALTTRVQKLNDSFAISLMPRFVNENSPFYNIKDNYNCLYIKTRNMGSLSLIGQGAGSLPTASNIIKDINNLNNPYKTDIKQVIKVDYKNNKGRFYLRTRQEIKEEYIEKIIGADAYITKEITIENLRSFLQETDFVGEIVND